MAGPMQSAPISPVFERYVFSGETDGPVTSTPSLVSVR
jgi:hypothetical protein